MPRKRPKDEYRQLERCRFPHALEGVREPQDMRDVFSGAARPPLSGTHREMRQAREVLPGECLVEG